MKTMMFLSACFMVIGLAAGGCGSGTDEVACQDGTTLACTCADGSAGSQVCVGEVWSDCECLQPPACQNGETQACVCTDGSSGAQVCTNGSWGVCECAGPACQNGATRACTCTDGNSGAQTCIGGVWGGCECAGPTCQNGATQACTCLDGSSGSQTCVNGAWGSCQCAGPDCQNGATQTCTCADGGSGTQTCLNGSWGVCECVRDCTEGQTQPCSCPDGTSGEQTCQGGAWSACQCGGETEGELTGTFASLTVASTITDSMIGEVTSTTMVYSRVEAVHTGNELTSWGQVCAIELDSGTSFLNTTFPDAFIDSLATEPRTGYLEETASGLQFVAPEGVELRGVHLDDPKNDALPTEPDDPRIWDQDGDGHPGLTVQVTGIVSGDMYIIQRDISSMVGDVIGTDRIEGLITFDNDMVTVGATNNLLLQGNDYETWQDPVAENSYMVFQRVDPSWTCQNIIANMDTLFD